MKTQHLLLSKIIPVLIFGIIMINAAAQDQHPAPGNNQNPQEENFQPPLPPAHGLNAEPPAPREARDEAPVPFDLPDLTLDQRDKVKKADLKQMSEMTPLRNQMHEKKTRLSTLLSTIPVDQKQVDQLADEIGKTVSTMLKVQIRHDQDLRSILTPDQQILFDARPKPWLKRLP